VAGVDSGWAAGHADCRGPLSWPDVEHAGGTLQHGSGVGRGGHAVAEDPSGAIDAPRGVIGSYGMVKAAVRDIGAFIDGSEPVIRGQLRELSAGPADD